MVKRGKHNIFFIIIIVAFLFSDSSFALQSEDMPYEKSSVSRLVGDSPYDIINQLDTKELDINSATYLEDGNVADQIVNSPFFSPETYFMRKYFFGDTFETIHSKLLEQGFDNFTTASSISLNSNNWDFDDLSYYINNFHENELFIIESENDEDNNLYSFSSSINPKEFSNFKKEFARTNPLFFLNAPGAGVSIPSESTYVSELTRYSTIIAPSNVVSTQLVNSILCNLKSGETIGDIYRRGRTKYYNVVEPDNDELIGLVLKSYSLYGNPLTIVNVPEDYDDYIKDVEEFCSKYYVLPSEFLFEGFSSQSLSTVFSDSINIDYNVTKTMNNFTIIVSNGLLDDITNPNLIDLYTYRVHRLPKGSHIKNLTYSFAGENKITIEDYPSYYNGNYTVRLCNDNVWNQSIYYKVNSKDDYDEVVLFVHPLRSYDCEVGNFSLYSNVSYSLEYYSLSPFYFDNVVAKRVVAPSSSVNLSFDMKHVNFNLFDGQIKVADEEGNVYYNGLLDKKLDNMSVSLKMPEEEKLNKFLLEYVENDTILAQSHFTIETKYIDLDIIHGILQQDGSMLLNLSFMNYLNSTLNISVWGELVDINKQKSIILNSNFSLNSSSVTFVQLEVNNLDRVKNSYILMFYVQFEDSQKVFSDMIVLNTPPLIDARDFIVRVGQNISFLYNVYDLQNDTLDVQVSGLLGHPVASDEDIGVYNVTVFATDGILNSTKAVKLTIIPQNYAPVLNDIEPIFVVEEDLVDVFFSGSDLDGDNLTFYMDDDKFRQVDDNWFEWQTKVFDNGVHFFNYTISDGFINVTKTLNVTVAINTNLDIFYGILPDLIELGEGVLLNYKLRNEDRYGNNMSYTLLGSSFVSLANNSIVWQTQRGYSSCDDVLEEGVIIKDSFGDKYYCEQNYSVSILFNNSIYAQVRNLTVKVFKSVYLLNDSQVNFDKEVYDREDSEIRVYWNKVEIPFDLTGYSWYVNGSVVLQGSNLTYHDLKKEDIESQLDLSRNSKVWLESNKTNILYLQVPYNVRLNNASFRLQGALNKSAEFRNEEVKIDFREMKYFGQLASVSCDSLCEDRGDYYYCTGAISCNTFNAPKGIVFESAILTNPIPNNEDNYLVINSTSYIKVFNSTITARGYSGCSYCTNYKPYDSVANIIAPYIVINGSTINSLGGNGGIYNGNTKRCADGADSGLYLNKYIGSDDSLRDVYIVNSKLNFNGGKPAIPEDGEGCASGDSRFRITDSRNVTILNSFFNGVTYDATAAVHDRYSGDFSGSSEFDVDIIGTLLFNSSSVDIHTGKGSMGDESDGGDSGDVSVDIEGYNLSFISSSFIFYSGNAAHGDCASGYCGRGGDSGDVNFELKGKGAVLIDGSSFTGYSGLGGNGDRYTSTNHSCWSDAGDSGDTSFQIGSKSIVINNVKNFDMHAGMSGSVAEKDEYDQQTGDAGDVSFDLNTYGDIVINDSILNLNGGTTPIDGAQGGDGGDSLLEFDSNSNIYFYDTTFYANAGKGSNSNAEPDSSSDCWVGGDGGDSDFDVDADRGVVFDSVNYYGNSGDSGAGTDDDDSSGRGGRSNFYVGTGVSGDVSINNSYFEITGGDRLRGETSAKGCYDTAGDVDFSVDSSRYLIIDNSKFNVVSGSDLDSRGYYGNMEFELYARRVFSRGSTYVVTRGTGPSKELDSIDKFWLRPKEEFTVNNNTLFKVSNLAPLVLNYKNEVLNKLKIYTNTFNNIVYVYEPQNNTLLVFDTGVSGSYFISNYSYVFTSDEDVYNNHVPEIRDIRLSTTLGHSFEFEDIFSNFSFYDEDGDLMNSVDYSWLVNNSEVDSGVYTGGMKPVLNSSYFNANDSVVLNLVPNDGIFDGRVYKSGMKIRDTNYDLLDKFNMNIHVGESARNVVLYDMLDKYRTEDERVYLDVDAINSYLDENCKIDYCRVPIIFSPDLDFEFDHFDFYMNYTQVDRGVFGVLINSSYFGVDDDVSLKLFDDDYREFWTKDLHVNDVLNIVSLKNITAQENSQIVIVLDEFDGDGNVVFYNISDDRFVKIDSHTFVWRLGYFDSGEYNVTVVALSSNFSETKTFGVNVLNVNREPVIGEIVSSLNVLEGDLAVINFNISDPDGFVNVTIDDSRFRRLGDSFVWNTSSLDSGEYSFRIDVDDGYFSDYFIVKVYVRDVLEPMQTRVEASLIMYDFEAGCVDFNLSVIHSGNTPISNASMFFGSVVISNILSENLESGFIVRLCNISYNEAIEGLLNTSFSNVSFNYLYGKGGLNIYFETLNRTNTSVVSSYRFVNNGSRSLFLEYGMNKFVLDLNSSREFQDEFSYDKDDYYKDIFVKESGIEYRYRYYFIDLSEIDYIGFSAVNLSSSVYELYFLNLQNSNRYFDCEIDFGDGTGTISPISLNVGGERYVLIEHNYVNQGVYNLSVGYLNQIKKMEVIVS